MLRELVQEVGRRRLSGVVGKRVMPPLDRLVNRMSGGRTRLSDVLFPTLMLTTTGAKTGLPRPSPLLYAQEGDAFVVCASNWGQERHPAWSTNLLANPEAMVETRKWRGPVKARLATEDEKRALWPKLTAVWPGYDDYVERAAGRNIRVFYLEPVELS